LNPHHHLELEINSNLGSEKSLDIISPTNSIHKKFLTALHYALSIVEAEREESSLDKRVLQKIWRDADIDHSGSLTWYI
jgi:hypothetical protein